MGGFVDRRARALPKDCYLAYQQRKDVSSATLASVVAENRHVDRSKVKDVFVFSATCMAFLSPQPGPPPRSDPSWVTDTSHTRGISQTNTQRLR
jgi:hypothetical protein